MILAKSYDFNVELMKDHYEGVKPSVYLSKRVLSISLTSSWQNCKLTKDFYIYLSHNMFRRLASCSRGGLDMTDKTLQQTKDVEIFWPQKSESGVKRF